MADPRPGTSSPERPDDQHSSPLVKSARHAERADTSQPAAAQHAGRGGLALTAGKLYFLVTGLVQQIALKQVLGLGGYGAFSTASSIGSICYNPLVQAGIQGVSRQTASAPDPEPRFRRLIVFHTVGSFVLSSLFFFAAQPLTKSLGAPHVALAVQLLSAVLFLYGIYAALVGYLNGKHRFVVQAGLDMLSATLRTVGLVAGGYFLTHALTDPGSSSTVDLGSSAAGAMAGFVVAASIVLLVAVRFSGLGRRGRDDFLLSHYARIILPLWGGQVLLNLLFQADGLLLRRFAASAALSAGLEVATADPYVGAYRASQLFCFLPFQLLTSITFVLFPLLAKARADEDRERVRFLVHRGLRISVLVAGALVTVIVAVPEGLLTLVFQREAAQLAGSSMRVLAIGMGSFAVLGVGSSALNGLGQEKRSLLLMAVATALVTLLCFALGRTDELTPDLLTRIAAATSTAMILTTGIALIVIKRVTGAKLPWRALGKTMLAGTCSALCVSWVTPQGHVATLLGAVIAAALYLVGLVALREVGAKDWNEVAGILGKRNTPP